MFEFHLIDVIVEDRVDDFYLLLDEKRAADG